MLSKEGHAKIIQESKGKMKLEASSDKTIIYSNVLACPELSRRKNVGTKREGALTIIPSFQESALWGR